MNNEQYRATFDMIAQCFKPIQLLPLAELRDDLSRAETLGPLLEPTAYIRGGRENLADQADLLAAAFEVRKAMERIAKRRGIAMVGDRT